MLCTATQQKNGHRSEEEAEKPEQTAAEKALVEKTQLEEQLKEMTEKYKRALADTENLRRRSQKMIEDAKLYGKDLSIFSSYRFLYFNRIHHQSWALNHE